MAREKPKGGLGAGGILLPPPPSSKNAGSNQARINPPPVPTSFQAPSSNRAAATADNLLLDFDTPTAPTSR